VFCNRQRRNAYLNHTTIDDDGPDGVFHKTPVGPNAHASVTADDPVFRRQGHGRAQADLRYAGHAAVEVVQARRGDAHAQHLREYLARVDDRQDDDTVQATIVETAR